MLKILISIPIFFVIEKYLCSECGKSFTKNTLLKSHMVWHGPSIFQCSECPANFKSQKHLKLHATRHQNVQFKCCKCSAVFSSSTSLTKHERKQTPNWSKITHFAHKFLILFVPLQIGYIEIQLRILHANYAQWSLPRTINWHLICGHIRAINVSDFGRWTMKQICDFHWNKNCFGNF